MEFDNKMLTTLVLSIIAILTIHFGFTYWSYLQLRNKKGPVGPRGPRGLSR
jgi:hypothetical protein